MTPEQRKLLSDPELTSGWPQEYELALAAALEDSRRLDVAEDLIRMTLNRTPVPIVITASTATIPSREPFVTF